MADPISAVAAINASNGVQLEAAATAERSSAPGVSFAEALKSTAMGAMETVQASETMTMASMHGKASLQDVVQATVKAELAVETAISVRNKMIESYQEIMRMPI